MDTIRINSIEREPDASGRGMRCIIAVQGCPHRCRNCHSPDTRDFSGGRDIGIDTVFKEVQKNNDVTGVTFSGGEPFCQCAAIAKLAAMFRAGGLSVSVHTGWTLEELYLKTENQPEINLLLKQTDILVDGSFLSEECDTAMKYGTSRNQRIFEKKTHGHYAEFVRCESEYIRRKP
jgi:anaerobic ribonucleoside-triphosphate reductase activating protein